MRATRAWTGSILCVRAHTCVLCVRVRIFLTRLLVSVVRRFSQITTTCSWVTRRKSARSCRWGSRRSSDFAATYTSRTYMCTYIHPRSLVLKGLLFGSPHLHAKRPEPSSGYGSSRDIMLGECVHAQSFIRTLRGRVLMLDAGVVRSLARGPEQAASTHLEEQKPRRIYNMPMVQ